MNVCCYEQKDANNINYICPEGFSLEKRVEKLYKVYFYATFI